VRDWHEQLGLTKKAIDVDNIMAQTEQEASDAAYLRSAGKSDCWAATSMPGLTF
jgi:hypothetical protein